MLEMIFNKRGNKIVTMIVAGSHVHGERPIRFICCFRQKVRAKLLKPRVSVALVN